MRSFRFLTAFAAMVFLTGFLASALADTPGVSSTPPPTHLVIIFMENHPASAIIGNPDAPYLNAFYKMGVRFTNYREGSTTGPSLPDYLQIAAGSGCGKTSDAVTAGDSTISAAGCTTTVWNQLQTQGTSWGVYLDAMPAACSPAVTYNNSGLDTQYVLKHNPATPFPSIWNDQAMCKAHVLPYTSFDPSAMPAVSFIAPSICNDQHGAKAGTTFTNCLIGSSALMKRGDDWLAARVPAMLANGATVLITYDEAGLLYSAEVGPGVTANTTNGTAFTHYSVLAAIEQAYGLDRLNGAASATPIPLPPGGPPPNQPPVARATVTCPSLSCAFDGTASTDPDGSVVDYQWSFGDGTSGSGSAVSHDYALAGTYDWTLTVMDDNGATDQTSGSVNASDPSSSTIQFVGSAGAVSSAKTPTVQVPGAGQAGDLLLLAIDVNSSAVTVSAPTGVGGWTSMATADANGMKSQVWWKLAALSDFGAKVTVPLGSAVKSSLQVMDYASLNTAQPIDTFASATGTTSTASHTSPIVNAGSDDWVVTLWSDKSSTTNAWTAPNGVATRDAQIGTGTGYISALAADSAQGVGSAPYGGLTATTNQPGSKAIMWTIALDDSD